MAMEKTDVVELRAISGGSAAMPTTLVVRINLAAPGGDLTKVLTDACDNRFSAGYLLGGSFVFHTDLVMIFQRR